MADHKQPGETGEREAHDPLSIVVIGAGPAGLTAAWELVRAPGTRAR